MVSLFFRSIIQLIVFVGASNVAIAKISPSPILEYRNLIGTYDFIGSATEQVWNINGTEYIGLDLEKDFLPIISIGVEGSFRELDIGRIPLGERKFNFVKLEPVSEGEAYLWFTAMLDGRQYFAFVKVSRQQVTNSGTQSISSYFREIQAFVLCVPARLSLTCAKFSVEK